MNDRGITEDDLHGYVDRVLSPARQAEVIAYLDAHPEIRQRVESYQADRRALRETLAPVAAEPVPSALNLARLIDQRRSPAWPRWRWAAAASILLLLGGIGGWSLHAATDPASRGIVALAQEATANYAVYAPDRQHPVEIRATDQPELVTWASRRLGYRVQVPDLSAAGYRFMGGRLVATRDGPGLMLMFDDDNGTRLVVLTRAMAEDRDTLMSGRTDGADASFTWSQHGVGYSLVGPLATGRLHPLADEVRRQVGPTI